MKNSYFIDFLCSLPAFNMWKTEHVDIIIYLSTPLPLPLSDRRHEKNPDDGETNSSRSLSVSDKNVDRKKETLSVDDKEDQEIQVWCIIQCIAVSHLWETLPLYN